MENFKIEALGGLSGLGRQAYDYEAFATHLPTGTRVRVYAHVDTSYQFQAYANVEAWTTDEGWSRITSLPTDTWWDDMPYGRNPDRVWVHDQALERLEGVRDELLRKADFVLG